MGEARRRKLRELPQPSLDHAALARVGAALRKLAQAASSNLGRDCYIHAALGQQLLAELGIEAVITAGYAAWRVGQTDGSVVGHVVSSVEHLPEGVKGFAYHAWLTVGRHLVDFTTYQLRRKAQELDAADGGHTDVEWCPNMLVLDRSQIASYRQVAQGNTGTVYYERHAGAETLLAATFAIDPEDLEIARLILSAPDATVLGPNHINVGDLD